MFSVKTLASSQNGTHPVWFVLDVMVVEAEALEVEWERDGGQGHRVGIVITRVRTAPHPLKQRLVHPPLRSATSPKMYSVTSS